MGFAGEQHGAGNGLCWLSGRGMKKEVNAIGMGNVYFESDSMLWFFLSDPTQV